MIRPEAKGWCPGAYRPMMSGDGLVVRVRPTLARLTHDQVLGLCDAAQSFGSGLIDLTSRANLQIRGVSEDNHEPLLARLHALDLLPDDPALEGRRNILVDPFWQEGDDTHRLTTELTARLGELPAMPAKVGYAIDLAPNPMFTANSADFRLERNSNGDILLRPDGMSRGRLVTPDTAIDALIDMAHWFVKTGGPAHRRMGNHVSFTQPPADWQAALPAAPAKPVAPGQTGADALYGAAFGQLAASPLAALLNATRATAMRVTPWRLFLLEDTEMALTTDFITDENAHLLKIDACPGAPLCTASSVDTRTLARKLAPLARRPLHISGCAKGCARPRACATTLVGENGAFNLVRNGRPWDEPSETGLAPETLAQRIGEF
ncbi:cobalamin biosynthesis protein CobG [Shimia aestuarii]|uniref:Precorrin-3B synthase n=1 Tax=Shimia aestuarii TaxID=254406 RepID=A0A1I4QZS3_9RHOB|nr:cobalamin biosynthesis protein CobG [Shimia aestuarii]SFM45518.1 precorrin-3B synthase [Shimia aestuarii]